MDSGPWFIWAWLADSTGTTGATGEASADATTGTRGPASPSPVAWKKNDIAISFSRHDSQPWTSPHPPWTASSISDPGSPSAPSSSLDSSASASAPALHNLRSNFLFLEADQDRQCQLYSRTGTSSPCNTNTTSQNISYLTKTGLTSSSSPAPDSFLLCSPSTVSFDAATEEDDRRPRKRSWWPKMPGSILPAPEQPCRPDPAHSTANTTSNTGQWRPYTARSGRSARAASPLFARWARRHNHPQPDAHDFSDSRSSTDRKSTSSSNGNFKRAPHTRDDGSRDNADAGGHQQHTYNLSTSAVSRSGGSSRRHSQSGLPPPLTREEFEALPLAIQRKYFSTLERLRFAQASGIDDISQHYDQITARNLKRRLVRQDRGVSEKLVNLRRRSVLESRFSSADSLAFASLPEKIKRRHFTREEQSALTRQFRASVILDAADEAVYKAGRRTSRPLDVPRDPDPVVASLPRQRTGSMDSPRTSRAVVDESSRSASFPESFYDTFRWLDEEEDLDLRLFLDDYHANLREDLPEPSKQRRPSFRRHLSISKIPFGRRSISSSRPATRDVVASPKSPTQSPLSASSDFHFGGHQRRKSRALSLITPRHTPHDSVTAIDPSAAHYQDPEARLKLRVYLASPQKFDEAIEFGFPSTDVIPTAQPAANEGRTTTLSKRRSRRKLSDDRNLGTFLADDDDDDDADEVEDDDDDKMSLNSDQPSAADPDSPQTPHAFDKGSFRGPVRVVASETTTLAQQHHHHHHHAANSKSSEGAAVYTQVPACSREMTLRMTLTRPDLRAHEEQIYGWQNAAVAHPQQQQQQTTRRRSPQTLMAGAGRKSQQQQLERARDDEPNVVDFFADGTAMVGKESMEKIFAGIDAAASNADQNVVRRLWNRVRRS